MKLLYTIYEIKGLNLNRLVNYLKKEGITLHDVKKTAQNRLRVGVNIKENKKFFAITDKLCYTDIKKIKDGGILYPLYSLAKNAGLILGGALFIALSVISNDFIFSFSFTGSGAVYAPQVREYLSGQGINALSRFSSIDLKALSAQILAHHKNLSFVSCSKNGNRLVIDSAAAEEDKKVLSGNAYQLKSDCAGVVESVKAYRGTPLVKVGDAVNEGDVLVDGYALIKEERVEINVIAYVTVLESKEFLYESVNDNEEELALAFALGRVGEEPVSYGIEKTVNGDKFYYKVILSLRRTMFAG